MTWSIKDLHSHKPKVCNSANCPLPYIACMQSIFPKTPTIKIKYKDKNAEERLNTEFQIVNVDPLPDLGNIGTQMPSLGDSGSGHWIINTESEPSRAVLVAMSTQGTKLAMGTQVQLTTHKTILNFIKTTLIEFEPLLEI